MSENCTKKKVAIVGSAPHWKQVLPLLDNPEFEIWGLNNMHHYFTKATRWFHMHRIEVIKSLEPTHKSLEWFRNINIPVYTLEKHEEIPTSVQYPLDEMIQYFDGDYFGSSLDYMLALAIYEGFEEIHIYGFDMAHETEYASQRPSGEYYIGIAKGKGIKVIIPRESHLLKRFWRYGYDDAPQNLLRDRLTEQKNLLKREAENYKEIAWRKQGAYELMEHLTKTL